MLPRIYMNFVKIQACEEDDVLLLFLLYLYMRLDIYNNVEWQKQSGRLASCATVRSGISLYIWYLYYDIKLIIVLHKCEFCHYFLLNLFVLPNFI